MRGMRDPQPLLNYEIDEAVPIVIEPASEACQAYNQQAVVPVPQLSFFEMLVNWVFSEVPRVVAPAIRATEMSAAIRPYSMAVAPDSSFIKRAKILVMELSYSTFVVQHVPTTVSVVRMTAIYRRTIAIGLRNIITNPLMEDCRLRGKRRGKKKDRIRPCVHSCS
jgi:hypothetical protein